VREDKDDETRGRRARAADDSAEPASGDEGGGSGGAADASAEPAPKRRSRRGGRTRSRKAAAAPDGAADAAGEASAPGGDLPAEAPAERPAKPARAKRRRTASAPQGPDAAPGAESAAAAPEPEGAGGAAHGDGTAAAPETGTAARPPRRRRKKAAQPHADEAPAAGAEQEAPTDEPTDAPSGQPEKRPSRTRRGGRRKKSVGQSAPAPGAGAAGEAAGERGDAAAQPAAAESADAGAAPAAASGVTTEAARARVEGETPEGAREGGATGPGESPATAHRRRGSRGGRRSRARKARLAAAEREALDRAAGEVAPEHGTLSPESELAEGALPPLPEEPEAGAAGTAAGPAAAAAAEAGAPAGGDEQAGAKTTGRRGRRGGRARGRPAGATAVEAEPSAATPEEAAATRPAERGTKAAAEKGAAAGAKKGTAVEKGAAAAAEAPAKPGAAPAPRRERPTRRDRGRPKAIVRENAARAATPPGDRAVAGVEGPEAVAHKVVLVSEQRNEVRVALVEDGRLAEMYFERPGKPSYLGDIYRAKVENVVPGMDAAFIDFGLEKNGFLYVDEVETEDGRRRGRRIADVLRPGQELTVQVMKDPMGSKGARLTTHLSLAGRYLVYVPGGSGVGVSRRLGQGERERLRDLSKQLRPRNAGLIVRTYAQGKGLDDLRRDLQYLSRLWSRLKKKAATVKAPGLVYSEVDIALEVARDTFNETCERMLVDDEKRFKALTAYLEKIAPELAGRVELYDGTEPLFEAHGVEEQIVRALERRVPLPSGGNLVIDHTEALTVIDVNSGRFTSGRSLEDTILRTNMEAAREVVRQLRLRDIGGIIVIDFIDMAHARNREAVLAKLEAELETDRTKTYVVELSPLGLVEMTRQNTTDGARGILTRTCQTCMGKARVLSEETVALAVERRVRTHARKSNAKALLVEVNSGVAERLEADGRLKLVERETKRRVFLESSLRVPVESIRILAEGSVAHVQSLRLPVSEGQEIELDLEFALTYSPRDAVGYVEGYMVIVEGGRQYLGERRRVRVTSTTRTGATAVPASAVEEGRRSR